MEKKTAIVTGASSGIGKAIAKLFLSKGFNVIMNSSNEELLQKTFKEFGSPPNAKAISGNVADKNTGQKLADAAIEYFGALDVLVNKAGAFAPKPFLDVEEKELDHFYNINLKGTFFCAQAAIKAMEEKGGSIINIGTVLV